jgi:hypothetical protein
VLVVVNMPHFYFNLGPSDLRLGPMQSHGQHPTPLGLSRTPFGLISHATRAQPYRIGAVLTVRHGLTCMFSFF